jgi:N-acylneuraminate cytidylyltransferase
MSICIIPARGGSKRIPRKNIKLFNGEPIIAKSINSALESGCFSEVVVSTDDAEIAEISRSFGALVPFIRPPEISDDFTGTKPVIQHAILECEKLGIVSDEICCVYPASPLINHLNIVDGLSLLRDNNNFFVFPIVKFPSSIFRSLKYDVETKKLFPVFPKNSTTRSQDLETAYYDAGQFYWGFRENWLNSNPVHENGIGIHLPMWESIDIDTSEDWARAEILWKVLKL